MVANDVHDITVNISLANDAHIRVRSLMTYMISLLAYPCMVANDVHDITVNISVCGR